MANTWVGDASKWCLSVDDLARWCLDLVPEESRITAPPYLRFLPRVVNMTAEHNGSGYGFRVGDLYLTAYQTLYKRARFSGTLSSNVPNAPGLTADLTIHRNIHAPDPANDWYELRLEGADVAAVYSDISPLVLTPFVPDGWQGLNIDFGPPVPNPGHEDHPHTWWLNFIPSYAFGG
jgi:hypothetical protein